MKSRLRVELLEDREVPAAGSFVIPVASGTGFQIGINNTGRIIEMQVDGAEFAAFAGQTQPAGAFQTIAQRLYSVFPDAFDQIMLVSNISPAQWPPTVQYYGVHSPVSNRIEGLGMSATSVFDFTAAYGSGGPQGGRLQSFIHMADRTVIRDGIALHEIMHRWANDLQNFFPLFGDGAGHWGISSVGGNLGGYDPATLRSLGNGLYDGDSTNGDDDFYVDGPFPPIGLKYSPLEKYLMGLIPASQVPPIQVALNAQFVDITRGIFSATGFDTLTIEEIQQAVGIRNPAYGLSQRNIRVATVVITGAPMTQAELDEMDTQVELFGRAGDDGDPARFNFWEATDGLGTLQMERLQEFIPGNRTVNDALAVGGDNARTYLLSAGQNGIFDTDTGEKVYLGPLMADFKGEVRVTTGDVDGDYIPDYIFATGPGAPTRFGVYAGNHTGYLIKPQTPFQGSEDFTGGAFVSAGDMNADGYAEAIVSADQGGGPRVVVYTNGGNVVADFLGIDDVDFRGGARTAVGDFNFDGRADLAVAAGYGGGPRVSIYSGRNFTTARTQLVADFFAFGGTDAVNLRNGVFLSTGDFNGDLRSDLVFGGGPGGAPRVFVLNGALVAAGQVLQAQASPLANFFVAGNTADRGGVRVAVKYGDRDSVPDLIVGSGELSTGAVRVYNGTTIRPGTIPRVMNEFNLFGDLLPGGVYVG